MLTNLGDKFSQGAFSGNLANREQKLLSFIESMKAIELTYKASHSLMEL